MPTVTKAELTEHLFNSLGLSKTESQEIINALFTTITETLKKDTEVQLAGFGNFKLRYKKERPGLNPKTKKIAHISARRAVTFRAGLKLKNEITQYARAKSSGGEKN